MKIDIEKIKKLPADVRKDFMKTFLQYEEKKKENKIHSNCWTLCECIMGLAMAGFESQMHSSIFWIPVQMYQGFGHVSLQKSNKFVELLKLCANLSKG